jgi:hypothetical protein
MHRKSHVELQKALGQEIPGSTKVRRLLKALKALTMAIPVATIHANGVLCTDSDASLKYLHAFISSSNDSGVRIVAGFEGKEAGNNNKCKKKGIEKCKPKDTGHDTKEIDW